MSNNKQKNSTITSSIIKAENEKIGSLSLKEQMMGVKSTKPLPNDFFFFLLE